MKKEKFKRYVLDLLSRSKHRTQRNLAAAMGISPQHLNAVLNGRNDPGRVFLSDLAVELGTSFASLASAYDEDDEASFEVVDGFASIPLWFVDRSAFGSRNRPRRMSTYLGFREDWIRQKGNPHKMELWQASGEMSPVIPEGSLVLVDTSKTQPLAGRIFLARHKGVELFCRVTIEAGRTLIWGENDDKGVQVESVGLNQELELLGLARWYGCELL